MDQNIARVFYGGRQQGKTTHRLFMWLQASHQNAMRHRQAGEIFKVSDKAREILDIFKKDLTERK